MTAVNHSGSALTVFVSLFANLYDFLVNRHVHIGYYADAFWVDICSFGLNVNYIVTFPARER